MPAGSIFVSSGPEEFRTALLVVDTYWIGFFVFRVAYLWEVESTGG